jgi:hypothetical protein
MKKVFVFIFIILLSSSLFSLSLFGAHDISRKYLIENEMIDSYLQPKITCQEEEYFLVPFINSIGEPILFVPINIKDAQVIISQTDSFNIKLIKSGFILKTLKNSDPNNYLSSKLLDRTDTLLNALNSKKAQLNGLSQKNYNLETNQQIVKTSNKLEVLIAYLLEIKENLSDLLSNQNNFLKNPDCDDVDTLINSFQNAFKNYDLIIQASNEYLLESELLITKIVADSTISPQDLSSTISIASPISNLNSQITSIYDNLSSTSSFYLNIADDFKGSAGNQKIQMFVDNLILRIEYIKYKENFEKYDSTFPKFSNFQEVVDTILNSEYKSYWKEQSDVLVVQNLYSQIEEDVLNAQYLQANEKTEQLKLKSKNIIDSGFVEIEPESNLFGYIFSGFLILILIVFLIILKKKKKSKRFRKKEDDIFNN